MTTTTGRDLITKADQFARDLARCDQPVDTALWESFDTTAYRLLRELVGPGRHDTGACTQDRSRLLQVIHAYPTPLRPPLDADLSITSAVRFTTLTRTELTRRVRNQDLPSRVVNGETVIPSGGLDLRADIAPADPADPHPLARLSTTIGALADLVSQERRHPGTVDALSDDAVRDATSRLLAWLAAAGRYSIGHGPLEDCSRPLVVAQYAERSLDDLGVANGTWVPLRNLTARTVTSSTGLSEQLDGQVHLWAAHAREELSRTIPSTQVMANVASLGTLMLAATHRLHALSPDTDPDHLASLTKELRGAADGLKKAEELWKSVTSLQPQGRSFGAASFELFNTLRTVLPAPPEPEKQKQIGLDIDATLEALDRGLHDLSQFVTRAQEATRACLNSELLFEPARNADPRVTQLDKRLRGEYVPVQGGRSRTIQRQLEDAIRPIRELSARQSLSVEVPMQAGAST